jgi:Fe-S-cluster containining protein
MTRAKRGAGLKFECTECGDCCRRRETYAFVYVNDGEINDLAAALKLTRRSFMRRHTFVDELGWRQLRFNSDHCPFLDSDTNRCTVYEARPTQCRTFPFWRDFVTNDAWTPEVRSLCEGVGEGKRWSRSYAESVMADKEAWDEE